MTKLMCKQYTFLNNPEKFVWSSWAIKNWQGNWRVIIGHPRVTPTLPCQNQHKEKEENRQTQEKAVLGPSTIPGEPN